MLFLFHFLSHHSELSSGIDIVIRSDLIDLGDDSASPKMVTPLTNIDNAMDSIAAMDKLSTRA